MHLLYPSGWWRVGCDPGTEGAARSETDKAFLAHVQAKAVPADATNIHVCDASELPYRGTLRNAWRQPKKGPPVMDMDAARGIKMAAIRAERNKRLAALDALSNRARDIGDDAELARVLTAKQALRDIPQTVKLDSITDPAELDAFKPVSPA